MFRPLAMFAVLELGIHGVAWACSCATLDTVEDALADSDLVVYGEVLSVRGPFSLGCTISSADPMQVRVEVLEAFEGAEVGDVITIETARDGASCGVGFQEGEDWLIYASGGSTGLCTRTRPADADDPELEELATLVQ